MNLREDTQKSNLMPTMRCVHTPGPRPPCSDDVSAHGSFHTGTRISAATLAAHLIFLVLC
jgi:hypothetical protein